MEEPDLSRASAAELMELRRNGTPVEREAAVAEINRRTEFI